MVCSDADELQARLALRALLAPLQNGKSQDENGAFDLGPSDFHRRIAAEVEEIFTNSLKKRLASVEKKVKGGQEVKLPGTVNGSSHPNGDSNSITPTQSAAIRKAPPSTSSCTSTEVQTNSSSLVSTESVDALMKKAYRKAAICARPRSGKLDFGASKAQTKLPDPPNEKKEESVPESVTLANSQKCLISKVADRGNQIRCLESQLAKCKEVSNQTSEDLQVAQQKLSRIEEKKISIPDAQAERLQHRQEKIAKLKTELERIEVDTKNYKALVSQQQAYEVQCAFLQGRKNHAAINAHPAGEVFLTLKPRSVADETVSETWDVGTAIANPYVCDSWPFEPNVLAQRTFNSQIDLQAVGEETLSSSDVEDDYEPLTRENFEDAFKIFDFNGNGCILASDLYHVMKKLGQTLSDKEVHEVLGELGVDANGQLKYAEFISKVLAK
jgi:hypothetical protein